MYIRNALLMSSTAPGAAHSVAWNHHKREIQLGSGRNHEKLQIAGFCKSSYYWKLSLCYLTRSAITPFQCLGTPPPKGSTRAGIVPSCPSLDRRSPDTKVGFERRTFRSLYPAYPTRCSWGSRGPHPGRRVAPKRFVIFFIPLCQVEGWPSLCSRHSELGTENSTLFGKRWIGMRNTCPNKRSFWCWTHSSMEVPLAQPKTRFLTASLRIRRHQPTRAMVLRQRLSNT
ncbi:hypothetical protein CSKR_103227 [Clonorchis sinensis]|uniref:Uncharacterized protein n=1 Tax=Clonorchis sinensis TaxID=79923 RepID=A0A3R7F6E4_CLOSI|nr:hypothetical protein CSKR_103227 [Clonorchis sinensis]